MSCTEWREWRKVQGPNEKPLWVLWGGDMRSAVARVWRARRRWHVSLRTDGEWRAMRTRPVSKYGTTRLRSWPSRASAKEAAERAADTQEEPRHD